MVANLHKIIGFALFSGHEENSILLREYTHKIIIFAIRLIVVIAF